MQRNRIVLFLLLFSLLLCSCRAAAESTVTQKEGDFISELTFLGDSITAHMQQRGGVEPTQIWATKNRYLNLDTRILSARIVAPDTGEEQTIATVAARIKPAYLVITLGVDYGVYYYRERPDAFRLCYEKLVNALREASPKTKLILQSVFPVARSSETITNDMIKRANAVICDIAKEQGLIFVDQTPVLSDHEGYLRDDYCYSEDGIHLTAKAYEAMLSHLSSLEKEIRGTT